MADILTLREWKHHLSVRDNTWQPMVQIKSFSMLTTSVYRNLNRMLAGKEMAPSIWLYWLTVKWMAEVRFPLGAGNSIICIAFRPTWLGVLGGLSLRIRRPQRESNHASQYSIKVKSVIGIPPHIPSELLKMCVWARVRAGVSYPGQLSDLLLARQLAPSIRVRLKTSIFTTFRLEPALLSD